MKTYKCICPQRATLRQTGNSEGDTQWYCPVCKQEYYEDKDGKLSKERPFAWPKKKSVQKKIWQIKNGNWEVTQGM
jgi:hypothetical protein